MLCPSCGRQAPEGANVCGYCGSAVAGGPPPPPVEPDPAAGGYPPPPEEPYPVAGGYLPPPEEPAGYAPAAPYVPGYGYGPPPGGGGGLGRAGGVLTAAMGVLVVLTTFMPWFSGGSFYWGWFGDMIECVSDDWCEPLDIFFFTDPFWISPLTVALLGVALALFGLIVALQSGSPGGGSVLGGFTLILAIAVVGTALVNWLQMSDRGGSAGYGIYLWLLGGLGAVAGSVLVLVRR